MDASMETLQNMSKELLLKKAKHQAIEVIFIFHQLISPMQTVTDIQLIMCICRSLNLELSIIQFL